MAAALWFIGAILLAVAETAAGEFILLMLGGGALITAGATGVFDLPLWAQGVVFAVSSMLMLVLVRPPLRRFVESKRGEAPSYLESLPGTKATVLQSVSGETGRVLIGGEEWSARTPYDGVPIAVGVEVTIVEIDGAVAVVVDS
ncbi:NfeD family protein [Tsukamurella asaccharolytica]|uniref:NfeD family protein n=1 Tax=Tsukamurella asaccharolytica TaxID=2592067 RepID=A0A5C5RAJ7_9ACTN|nr:NfeD family protein [Tsukamurella asaccharolytica]TWS19950.1 NfeD family protein [Tsukamurella asaccharolytica]